MSRIEESISKLKRFKYHAIGRLELEDAIDNVVSWYEQMMKDAVECKVFNYGLPQYPGIFTTLPDGEYNEGDKVRVIIVKED